MSTEESEIEKLRGEVAKERRRLAAIPAVDLNAMARVIDPEGRAKELRADLTEPGREKAECLRSVAEAEERLALALEARRVREVVREHEELHPPQMEECPICLDEIRIANAESGARFSCCGNILCMSCVKDQQKEDAASMASGSTSASLLVKCPLCRESFGPQYAAKSAQWLKEHAKKKKSWAVAGLAGWYHEGTNGCPVNKRKALELFQQAAEQKNAEAMYHLAKFYEEGTGGVAKSKEQAAVLMKEAADLGKSEAQRQIGAGSMERNTRNAIRYTTLAASQGNAQAEFQLGSLFTLGAGGFEQSYVLAKHYLGLAAKKEMKDAYYTLARAIFFSKRNQYEGRVDMPGHSCIPLVLFWARKAERECIADRADAAKLIKTLEGQGKSQCSYCIKKAVTLSKPLKQCVRCKAAFYCGKECQVLHWKAGHKINCIKQQ